MKHRKKIDDIYRERLRDVETPPPADSWDYISSQLPKKKKNSLLPLWFRAAGVAAALAALFMLFTYNPFTNAGSDENKITDRPVEQINEPGTSTAFEEAGEEDNSQGDATNGNSAGAVADSATENSSEIVSSGKASENRKEGQRQSRPATDAVVHESEGAKDLLEARPAGSEAFTTTEQLQESAVATEEVIQSPESPDSKGTDHLINLTEAEALAELRKERTNLPEEPGDEDPEKSEFVKRFRVSTTAGAVYFDNLGNGNSLDERFAENAGGGEISMSYGINLAYKISEKVKLRSGLNKVNLTYNTRNVDYYSAMQSQAVSEDPSASGILIAAAPGSLSQELGFIEVPMELEYVLLDKKLGVNLIGGGSALFLENNNLSLESPGFTTSLGEAKNLNNLSFSANLGVGVHYNLSSQFRLNLEPIFKYQLNTFNNIPGLKPYYFGIYSGVSFGF